MADQDTMQTGAAAQRPDTSEEEVNKILEDKAAIVDAQEESAEDRSSEDVWTAEDSTGVNADLEEPIDPKMPRMPPA